MLCIGRRLEEKVVIGDGPGMITITVIRIDKNQVKLGIEAPKTVSVHREEIYRVIKRAGGNLLFGTGSGTVSTDCQPKAGENPENSGGSSLSSEGEGGRQ